MTRRCDRLGAGVRGREAYGVRRPEPALWLGRNGPLTHDVPAARRESGDCASLRRRTPNAGASSRAPWQPEAGTVPLLPGGGGVAIRGGAKCEVRSVKHEPTMRGFTCATGREPRQSRRSCELAFAANCPAGQDRTRDPVVGSARRRASSARSVWSAPARAGALAGAQDGSPANNAAAARRESGDCASLRHRTPRAGACSGAPLQSEA